jgi:hypothetical protein
MSDNPPKNLEEAIRQSGEAWLIDSFAPPDKAIEYLRRSLEAVDQRAQQRLGGSAPNLSEAAIVMEFAHHPQSVRGFFQALGGTRTPDMLLMVWRIIQGMEIKDITLNYERQKTFVVQVTLESPYGDEDEVYESNKIQDFALFRHVGIIEIGDKPVFDGFYPLKVR